MPRDSLIPTETVIALDSVPIRFGLGASQELGYELNNRTGWVRIPTRGIMQILEEA